MPRVRKPKGPREPRSRQAPPADPAEASGTAVDFWELVKSISRSDWDSGYQVYLYRTWPRIDRRDGEHFISKIKEDFDEEFLMRNWGTGKYYLRLNNSKGQTIASRAVSVYDVNYPPKVNPEEILAGDPANERYFAAWPKKSADRDPGSDPGGQGNDAVMAAVKEFSKITQQLLERGSGLQEEQRTMLRAAHDESLRLVVDQAKTDARPLDSLGMLEKILAITDKLRPEAPTPVATSPDPLEMLEKILNITKNLQPAPAAPESDPVAQLSALLDLSEKLEGRFGRTSGDSSTASTAKAILEGLPAVLEKAKAITGDLAIMAAARARGGPVAASASAAPGPGAVAAPTGPEAAPSPGPIEVPDPRQAVNENLRRTIANMLLRGDLGEDAALVAEKTDPAWAAEFAKVLRVNPAALAGDPIFAPALASPRLPQFVAEFLGYFEPEPEGSESSDKTAEAASE